MRRTVEFDTIAPLYDETRRPPSDDEIQTLVSLFAECHTILDAGIGTGRFAAPLLAQGFDIVGVDLSVRMMERARVKGVASLVRADLRRLPLRTDAVEAAFMAHVLQLLADPRDVLRELGRVSRRRVVVLLPDWSDREPRGPWRELRERYRAIAAELGYTLPERPPRYQHTVEELSALAVPLEVRSMTVPPRSDATREEWMTRWAGRWLAASQIPPEVHAEIVRRLQAEQRITPGIWNHPRSERFICWSADRLRAIQ